jgi:hypothetical protein
MPTKTKKSQIDLAQELGIIEEPAPEVSSHLQKLLNRKQRGRQQALQDWHELVEAQIQKEYIPHDLIQETFEAINDNERLDAYTCLLNDARDLQTYRRGQRHKKIDQRSAFIERHGDRPSLVKKLQSLKEEAATVKQLLREHDSIRTVDQLTGKRADHIEISNSRLFPRT